MTLPGACCSSRRTASVLPYLAATMSGHQWLMVAGWAAVWGAASSSSSRAEIWPWEAARYAGVRPPVVCAGGEGEGSAPWHHVAAPLEDNVVHP